MIAAPAFAATTPSATISSTETGIAGCRSRVQAPLSAASIQTLGMAQSLAQGRQFVDQPGNDAQAPVPEFRIAGIEPERRQQFGMVLGAAGREHGEITLGETGGRLLVNGVERIHQAIAERIGIDVERRMDEMRNVGPERLV